MKKGESGITLISLVITIVVLFILAAVLVHASLQVAPSTEALNNLRNDFQNEQTETEEKINEMTNGWEDVIL